MGVAPEGPAGLVKAGALVMTLSCSEPPRSPTHRERAQETETSLPANIPAAPSLLPGRVTHYSCAINPELLPAWIQGPSAGLSPHVPFLPSLYDHLCPLHHKDWCPYLPPCLLSKDRAGSHLSQKESRPPVTAGLCLVWMVRSWDLRPWVPSAGPAGHGPGARAAGNSWERPCSLGPSPPFLVPSFLPETLTVPSMSQSIIGNTFVFKHLSEYSFPFLL